MARCSTLGIPPDMTRRVPPALRRSGFLTHLMAGVTVAPLLALAIAGDDVVAALRQSSWGEKLFAREGALPQSQLAVAEPAPDSSAALPLEQAPVSTSDPDEIKTASLSTGNPFVMDVPPAATAAEPATLRLPQPDFVASLPAEIANPPFPVFVPIPRAIVPAISDADVALVKQGIAAYRRGDIAAGDGFAAQASSATAKLTLEWSAARLAKQALGFTRLAEFVRKNPDLPMRQWVEARAADTMFTQKISPERVFAFFGNRTPESAAGKVVLARALLADGKAKEAQALARAAYRDYRTPASTREVIAREFTISTADQRYLIERLIYEGKSNEGLSLAAKAGPSVLQLAQLLNASVAESGAAPQLLAKLAPALKSEPAALFAASQAARRANKPIEAGQALLAAPNDPEKIVDGDEWWTERRMVARKLMDAGDPAMAYRVAAAHHAETSANIVDAEVHSGWIALRFLNNPNVALMHFAKARAAAEAPSSLARAEYWQGRAAEALGDPFASNFHAQAAQHRHTYYGQLSLARIGREHLPDAVLPLDEQALHDSANQNAMKIIRALIDADAKDLAQPLVFDLAKRADDMIDVVVLGDLLAQYRLPKMTLQAGKVAALRGMLSEEHAFPTFGIPEYEPAAQSAEPAIVYSIARQESEFDPAVISHAGARGLMQLMPATAIRTANRQKIGIDINKLTTDPSLNARIGAAHLAELMGEYNGSYILTFAAYNAGGKRVREWTTAYGDPRDPDVDKVDWVERIPITETRNYVQKILENLQVYRARMYGRRHLGIVADMERGARQPRATADNPALSIAER